jgi:hypothetical protein
LIFSRRGVARPRVDTKAASGTRDLGPIGKSIDIYIYIYIYGRIYDRRYPPRVMFLFCFGSRSYITIYSDIDLRFTVFMIYKPIE